MCILHIIIISLGVSLVVLPPVNSMVTDALRVLALYLLIATAAVAASLTVNVGWNRPLVTNNSSECTEEVSAYQPTNETGGTIAMSTFWGRNLHFSLFCP